jgi:methanogenic corrinoid protein MtbC1
VWEKRYGVVRPDRTDTNRRLYSEEEVERLALLRCATQAGHNISQLVQLPNERLAELAKASSTPLADAPASGIADLIKSSTAAVRALNTRAFEEVLERGAVALGQHGLLERVVGPLAQEIGDLWRDGTITAAHEHFASAIIRNFLVSNYKPFAYTKEMPGLIVATPAGQLHELGAVIVAAAANDLGWRVVYLGTSLPAAEIAGAALQHEARAVALSIVYPEDDSSLELELRTLRRFLPSTGILVGGRAAGAYAAILKAIDAILPEDLNAIYHHLDNLRKLKTRDLSKSGGPREKSMTS